MKTRPATSAGRGGERVPGLPTKQEILRYLADSPGEVTKRDVVRAFKIKGHERSALKQLLRELEAEGSLSRGHRRRVRSAGRLPSVAVLEVTSSDADGDLVALPAGRDQEEDEGEPPAILLLPVRRGPAPAIGDRVLARLSRDGHGSYQASVIRVLPGRPRRMVGVVEDTRAGLRVSPIGRQAGDELKLEPADAGGAKPGEVVTAERVERGALGLAGARVIERLGEAGDARAISLMTAHLLGLPIAFAPGVEAEAESAQPVALGRRLDLRAVPLVTIDGPDARDFDDAVYAAPDDDPDNPGGWRVWVAIADVAHYVRPGGALDREARRRGNSVYFPDRVLPMLPHPLSSNLCSLRPGEDRACLAADIRIGAKGAMRRYRFHRALMRSAARLTYEQVQAGADGEPDRVTAPLVETVIRPLYGAFQALLTARRRRGTLDLDLPETWIRLDDEGRPAAIEPRPRLDSHRLIEELMICANVAAAQALEQAGAPCMYRVHDRPDPVKLEALAQLLDSLGLPHGRGTLSRPKDLARLLERVRGTPLAPLVGSFVLRAQSQAVYSPHNIGHFGLNLGRYAHFTSPIRRYADLLVHRALIRALKLGDGGLEDRKPSDDWRELGQAISRAERRAMEAEREALSRFVALLMTEQVGEVVGGTVQSVQRFGVFVQLDGSQVDGLVPVSALGGGWFDHDPTHHALIDQAAGVAVALGDRVRVELTAADPVSGQLTFRLAGHEPGPASKAALRAAGRGRRRPPSRRRRFGR